MNLEIFGLFRDAADAGTTRFSRLSNAIFWDGKHCMFISGECSEVELCDCFEKNRGEFDSMGVQKLHFESEGSLLTLEGLGDHYKYNTYDRITLVREPAARTREGTRNTINAEDVIRGGCCGNLEGLVSEVTDTWGDVALFLEHSFGVCYVEDSSIKGWCLSEYNSPRKCGIGIETIEEYRQQGIADAMTKAFIARCDGKGLVSLWDSWARNAGSVKTALKNGFRNVGEYKSALVFPCEER